MALILGPPKWLSGRNIPAAPKLVIDWSHPLTNGLVACFIPGISAGINLVGISIDLTPVNAAGVVTIPAVTSEGPGWKTTKSGDGLRATVSSNLKPNQLSLYWRGTINTVASAGVLLTGIDYDNALTSPFVVASIQTQFSGPSGPPIEMTWNTGGTLQTSSTTTISGTAGDGTINSFAATFLPGGNAILYKAGAQVVSTSFGASNPNYTATSAYCVNSEIADNNRQLAATCNLACMWNRVLSADEIAALDREPYAFLIPAESQMPALRTVTPSVATVFNAVAAHTIRRIESVGY